MGKDWKYILYISLAFGLFVAVKLLAPKQYNWAVTLAHSDKNPYGTYVLNQLLPGIFPNGKISHSYKTFYELKDSIKEKDNVISISNSFNLGKEDADVLLAHVANGGTALISAHYFWGYLADTINVSTTDYFFNQENIFTKSYFRSFICSHPPIYAVRQ